MVERHISMRGEVVDFNRLRLNNSTKPALGNSNMNARGDIIGTDGVVIKTQEQIDADYQARIAAEKAAAPVAPVNIKDQNSMTTAAQGAPPGLQPKMVNPDDADFEPTPRPRRKIVESDQ